MCSERQRTMRAGHAAAAAVVKTPCLSSFGLERRKRRETQKLL
jgi:hypothetical protein